MEMVVGYYDPLDKNHTKSLLNWMWWYAKNRVEHITLIVETTQTNLNHLKQTGSHGGANYLHLATDAINSYLTTNGITLPTFAYMISQPVANGDPNNKYTRRILSFNHVANNHIPNNLAKWISYVDVTDFWYAGAHLNSTTLLNNISSFFEIRAIHKIANSVDFQDITLGGTYEQVFNPLTRRSMHTTLLGFGKEFAGGYSGGAEKTPDEKLAADREANFYKEKIELLNEPNPEIFKEPFTFNL
jgi:hypothetical protein